MKFLLILTLLALPWLHVIGSDDAWSTEENGLRGRLFVYAPEKADSPFCRVFIELENTAKVMGQRSIRFSPGKLDLRVTGKDGKELPIANGPYDGFSPGWKPILLPFAGNIKFQISFPGLGYRPGEDKVIVDLVRSWIVPQDGDYFLSGTLTIGKEPNDHPYMDWSGTITFPKVKIPKAK